MRKYASNHKVVSALLLLGVLVVLYRMFAGLGAVSALSDSQPWGLVKALNILGGAALAAGSFVVAALAYVFGMKRFRPVVRPALLMGFIGHTFVLAALLYDVGRPYNVYRIIFHPNIHSAMLLTFACEAVYTATVVAEVLPEFWVERFGGLAKFLHAIKGPVVVLSATAAVVYQGTLGTLYLVSPRRISPLWYGPLLPSLFFTSAVAAGVGMVVVEAYLSGRAGRRPFDACLMGQLGALMAVFVALYLFMRLASVAAFGGFAAFLGDGLGPVWFSVEIGAGFALPLALLLFKGLRENPDTLFAASVLVAGGTLMDRLGVVVIGWSNAAGAAYFPSALEVYASFFFFLAPVALYSYASGVLLGRESSSPHPLPLSHRARG